MNNKIVAYTDGGCRGNQFDTNVGGWGVTLTYNGETKDFYGGCINTTNNIMELTSCIEALKSIEDRDIPVEIIMDSQYVIMGINSWVYNWVKNGWKTSAKKKVENKELWIELFDLKNKFKDITFSKVKGHSDNVGNNRADELANIAMDEVNKNI